MKLTNYTYVRPENVALEKISIFLMLEAAILKDLDLEVKTQDPRVIQLVSNFPCWPVTAYVTMLRCTLQMDTAHLSTATWRMRSAVVTRGQLWSVESIPWYKGSVCGFAGVSWRAGSPEAG